MKKILTLIFGILLIYSCGSDSSESPEVPLSSDNFITTFIIKRFSSSFEANIQGNSITGLVPSNIALTEITLDIEVSEGAKINPDPRTINSLTDAFILTITAENGTKREYNVDISRELDSENGIVSFKVILDSGDVQVHVDDNGNISKRFPSFIDLANLTNELVISEYATIEPDPNQITDFSSEVIFMVTAENGNAKSYIVNFEVMDEDFEVVCDESNATKWFGGDDRVNPDFPFDPFDRNVGTGQVLTFSRDMTPDTFAIALDDGFRYSSSGIFYDKTCF